MHILKNSTKIARFNNIIRDFMSFLLMIYILSMIYNDVATYMKIEGAPYFRDGGQIKFKKHNKPVMFNGTWSFLKESCASLKGSIDRDKMSLSIVFNSDDYVSEENCSSLNSATNYISSRYPNIYHTINILFNINIVIIVIGFFIGVIMNGIMLITSRPSSHGLIPHIIVGLIVILKALAAIFLIVITDYCRMLITYGDHNNSRITKSYFATYSDSVEITIGYCLIMLYTIQELTGFLLEYRKWISELSPIKQIKKDELKNLI